MRTLNIDDIIDWFNTIRKTPEHQRNKILDAFWHTQINGKWWILDNLNNILNTNSIPQNIYIFGGWIGVLSSLILQRSNFHVNKIFSIDLEDSYTNLANMICIRHRRKNFKAITCDMAIFEYAIEAAPTIVINTSTEHVNQKTFDDWYDKIPLGTLVIAQGNNYFSHEEHIRCAESLQEFKQINHVTNPIYEGILPNHMYDRYMAIWYK